MSSKSSKSTFPQKDSVVYSSAGSSTHKSTVSFGTPTQGKTHLSPTTEEDLHSSLRHRLNHLRKENSQLVTQSHHLVSELEDTSHHLHLANSKISGLKGQLLREKADPSRERAAILSAQVTALQDKLTKNAGLQSRLDHLASQKRWEKEESEMRQRALQDQLGDVQEECRRLREACSLAEQRASEKELSAHRYPYLDRSLSSQSLGTHPSLLQSRKPSDLYSSSTRGLDPPAPLANSTLLDHSLSGSTTSLSSLKSTQSAKEFPTSYSKSIPRFGTTHTYRHGMLASTPRSSYLGHSSYSLKQRQGEQRGNKPSVELERGSSRIRQLEREVSVLERHLADKTRSAQSHVEELTQLRTELAQERAALTMLRQETREKAASDLVRAKAVHMEQCRELQEQVERLQGERTAREREVSQLRAGLKASHSEAASLSERVTTLLQQLEHERTSHTKAMQVFQSEVRSGSAQVSHLESALEECRNELAGHVIRVEEATQLHKSEVEHLKKQVDSLSAELAHTRHQLSDRTALAERLQSEVGVAKMELGRGQEAWREREGELRRALQQSESVRQSLLQQLERSSKELAAYSGKLAEHQQAALEAKQRQSELTQLQRRIVELEQEREEGREERGRLRVEEGQLRSRLESVGQQLEQARERCREEQGARKEADREVGRLREELQRVRGQLESCQSELAEAEEKRREREGEVETTLSHMQQELAKRAQQVMEMDSLLRSHQADTTARRLQLERTLTQRQANLRSRTQQLEEVSLKYSEAQKTVVELRQQVAQLQSVGESISSTKQKQLQAKTSEVISLQQRLEEAESVGGARGREAEAVRSELGEERRRGRGLEERCRELEKRVDQLQRENDSLQEQHINQVQRLQETHATLLASREQQASSYRAQLQQLVGQERMRQEEVSRCRAQVASLSAELAAERRMAEEGRQQLALVRAEAARYQAQVSSLQRALSLNNMANMALHKSTSAPSPAHNPSKSTFSPSTTHPSLPPHLTPSTTSLRTSYPVSKEMANENTVAMETTLFSETDSDVEFAQLPVKLSTPSLPSKPQSSGSVTMAWKRGEIMDV